MRWSVLVSLTLLALFGLGLRAMQPDLVEPARADPVAVPAVKTSDSSIKETITSDPCVTESAALENVHEKVRAWLLAKRPQMKWSPPPEFVNGLIKGDPKPHSEFSEAAGLTMTTVSVDVALTADDTKKMLQGEHDYRVEARLWGLARIVGGLMLLFGAIAGCIRLNEWTKGYLTWTLRLAAIAIGAGGAATIWFLI